MLNKILHNPNRLKKLIHLLAFWPITFLQVLTIINGFAGNELQDASCHSCMAGLTMVSNAEGWAWDFSGNIVHLQQGQPTWQNTLQLTMGTIDKIVMNSANDGWAISILPIPGSQTNEYYNQVLHYQANRWNINDDPNLKSVSDIAMLASDDGWAVGANGMILHYDGFQWKRSVSPVQRDLWSIAMLSQNEGWAIGKAGTIVHYFNGTWSTAKSFISSDELEDVTITSSKNVWITLAGAKILHFDGTDWQVEQLDLPDSFQTGDLSVKLLNEHLAVAFVSGLVSGTDVYAKKDQVLLVNEQGQWRVAAHINPGYTITSMVGDDVWAYGSAQINGAQQGVIAQLHAGVWHEYPLTRLPESSTFTNWRLGIVLFTIMWIALQSWMLGCTFVPDIRNRLRGIWLVRLNLLSGVALLAIFASNILEPLLFAIYNRDFLVHSLFVMVGLAVIMLGCLLASLFIRDEPAVAEEPLL